MQPLANRRAERAAGAALALTALLAAAKLWAWTATQSLAVLGQALDSVVDIVALGLLFLGVRIAGKPADESHHYGHGKAENLVAFTQTLFLGAVVVALVWEAATRLAGDVTAVSAPWYAFALLGLSAVVDAGRVAWLTKVARTEGSDALRAGALNLSTDMGTALVALASLVAVRFGWDTADAYGALVVAVAVAVAGSRLGKRSVDVLMDRAPDARIAAIYRAAGSAGGVEETRRIRVRSSGDQLFADVTVAAGRTTSLQRAHDIAENVEREIARVAPKTDVVVHVEPISETTGLIEQVEAAASRVGGIRDVHNVLVHAFEDDGRHKLHITLHAKVDGKTSLHDAHGMSDSIEEAVRDEIGTDARVDCHIEPLERTEPGRDVTAQRGDVVASVTQAAAGEPDIIDCHEVIVTGAGDHLRVVAHVRARGDLHLERIHDASERVEKLVQRSHPEVMSLVIHFEPA